MTTEQTAGTPPEDDGDAAEQSPTTGTPNGDGRDAEQGEPDFKALYLASKDKIESVNRMQAELAALRARQEQIEAPDDDVDQSSDAMSEVLDEFGLTRDEFNKLQDYANRGDVAAKASIAAMNRQVRLARDVRDSFTLRDISDTDERKQVLAHYAKNRHRLGDVKAAEAEIRKGKLEAENATLRKQLEAAMKRPPTDVVRTHSREVSATTAQARKMTAQDFDREQAQLRAAGRHEEAMARQRELMTGAIDIPD